MNVNLIPEISLIINSAKLVTEEGDSGTIQFTILGQPVCLNLSSNLYVYDINLSVGDRIKLAESYGSLDINSEGIIKEIIPDYTEDRAKVLFDKIFPEQIIRDVEAHVTMATTSLLIELPLKLLEKL